MATKPLKTRAKPRHLSLAMRPRRRMRIWDSPRLVAPRNFQPASAAMASVSQTATTVLARENEPVLTAMGLGQHPTACNVSNATEPVNRNVRFVNTARYSVLSAKGEANCELGRNPGGYGNCGDIGSPMCSEASERTKRVVERDPFSLNSFQAVIAMGESPA